MPDLFLGAVLRHARRALERRTPPTADALLLDRFARDRDAAAFTELVARHGPGVWSACRCGTANDADAEDVFQATFLVLARKARSVRQAASVGSWLFGTAVRLARKARSRRGRAPDPMRIPPPASVPDPRSSAAWREVRSILDEELARLPDTLRAPLLCCYFDGLTQDEAANRLGWKVRTVKSRIARGRKMLGARLRRRGVDLSAALAAAVIAKEGASAPPAASIGLERAAIAFARRGSAGDGVSASALTLAREGVAMSRWKLALVVAACAAVIIAAGTGYVIGQGKPADPPATPGTTPAAAKTDLAGDPLPPGAVARLGTTRLRRHDWGGRAFLLSAGDRVLWLGQDGKVTYWDVATGKATDTFTDPDLFPTHSSALSPDGERLALFGGILTGKGYSLTLRLYDLKAKKTAWTARPADADRQSGSLVEFTPDGRRLITSGGEGDVRVWDVKTGTELLRQRFRGGRHIALSPDGKTIASGEDELYLWDWEAGGEPRRIGARARTRYGSIQFSADGKTVYAHPDYGGLAIKAFDVATGRPTAPLDLGGRAAWFSFSPDGKTAAVAYYGPPGEDQEPTIALRDMATGKELRRLSAERSRLTGLQWSRDGSRVACFAHHRMLVWDANSGRRLSPDLPGHDGGIQAIAFAADGRVFTSGHDPTVRAWDPATGKELLHMATEADRVLGLAVSPDGSLVAANALGNEVRMWDSRTGKQLFRLLGHGRYGGVRKVRFSADEQTLVAFGDDFYLRAWDALTGKLKSEHRLLPRELAGLDDDEQRMQMETRALESRALDLGPDGNTFVRASGKDVTVYAVDSGKERFKVQADPQYVAKLALSADGKWMATGGRGVEPGKGLPVQKPDDSPKDYQVTVWNMDDATVVTRFRVPTKIWWSVLAFTADGRSVVAGSWDPVLRFYNAKTGEATGTLDLPLRAECVAFSPDGERVAVGFLDTTALVYDLAKALKPAKKE